MDIAKQVRYVVTVEEGCKMGGFGSAVLEALSDAGVTVKTKVLGLPDWYIEQGPQDLLRERYGLTTEGIYRSVKELVTKSPITSREHGTLLRSGLITCRTGTSRAVKPQIVRCTLRRRPTRQIQVGKVKIGGDAPVSVQSMCSTDTSDVAATVEQIRQLEAAGCETDPRRGA